MSIKTILKLSKVDPQNGERLNVCVCRDSEWQEYIVKIEGKTEADYHTDSKQDAMAQASFLIGDSVSPSEGRSRFA